MKSGSPMGLMGSETASSRAVARCSRTCRGVTDIVSLNRISPPREVFGLIQDSDHHNHNQTTTTAATKTWTSNGKDNNNNTTSYTNPQTLRLDHSSSRAEGQFCPRAPGSGARWPTFHYSKTIPFSREVKPKAQR